MNIKVIGGMLRDVRLRRKAELASQVETFVNNCQHAPYPEGRTCAGHAPFGRLPIISRTNGAYLKASEMTSQKLSFIDQKLNGVVIRDLDSGKFLDPDSVSHDVYRLHQIDLGGILDRKNPKNLYNIIKDQAPMEIVPPGETGSLSNLGNAASKPGERPRSPYRVYDTMKEYGVNIAVILDESNGKVITIIPTTSDLETKKEAMHRDDRRGRNGGYMGRAANEGRAEARNTILSKKTEDDQMTEILTTDQIREKRKAI